MEERKNSAARIRANNKYAAKAYDRINIAVPKGRKDVIQEYAQQRGESINAFIGRAIWEAMERDGGGAALEIAGKRPEATPGDGVVSLPSEDLRTTQEATEAGKWPVPTDKAKAVENLFAIFENFGAVDLDEARRERLGIVCLPPDTLEAAQRAADAAGEAVADFMQRAVAAQAQRDQASLKLGINPATGGKLEKEA